MTLTLFHRINDDTPVFINADHIVEMWGAKQEDTYAPVKSECYIAIRLTGQRDITRYLPRTPYGHPLEPEQIRNPFDALQATYEVLTRE